MRVRITQQIGQLDQEMASLLHPHREAVERLAEVPGLGVDSARRSLPKSVPPQHLPLREMSLFLGWCLPR
jgi:hypothetical protein